jgi:hypothetical protein
VNDVEARYRVLKQVVDDAIPGTSWDDALELADRFSNFVIFGDTRTPNKN